jgi:hypothetical protein
LSGESEAVNLRLTENIMDKRLIITHKTLHGEQKIEQYEAHKKTKQLMEACNVLIVVYGA